MSGIDCRFENLVCGCKINLTFLKPKNFTFQESWGITVPFPDAYYELNQYPDAKMLFHCWIIHVVMYSGISDRTKCH